MKKESMKIDKELIAMTHRLDNIKPQKKESKEPGAYYKNAQSLKWITRPSTKSYRAALAKKDREQEKWKYQSWNGKTKPDKEPLMTYIDRIERDFPDKK